MTEDEYEAELEKDQEDGVRRFHEKYPDFDDRMRVFDRHGDTHDLCISIDEAVSELDWDEEKLLRAIPILEKTLQELKEIK